MGFWNLFANSWIRGTRKPLNRNTNKPKKRSLGLEILEDRTNPTSFLNFVDPNPSAGNGFGTTILSLGSGKVAVTAPNDDYSGLTDAGSVYVFNGSTGALVSTIRGSHTNDHLGSGGLFAVGTSGTGNFLIASPDWDNSTVSNAGALTFVSGSPASSITVDGTNSLVGSTANDAVGTGANVKVLTNNNYVVASPLWDGAAANVGAVTWGSGSTGVVGTISSGNSYVGTTASDQVGSGGIAALSNGNYAFASPLFDTTVSNAGAVTWGSGSAGSTGTVGTSNSWYGSLADDQVGSGGVVALTGNGNFVISSPLWDLNGDSANLGAATWVNGSAGSSGAIASSNSFYGANLSDRVGSGGIYPLTNGSYVICSPLSVSGNGSFTWSSGTSGSQLSNVQLGGSNSIQGSSLSLNDAVGNGGVVALNNGSFVALSLNWNGTVGAATWGSGTATIAGNLDSTNSLVGSTSGDFSGATVTALATSNGNYVVNTPNWDNGATANVGAVTWGSRSAGVVGTIGAASKISGSAANDQVGSGGIATLANGNYVLSSPLWNNGATADVGAVTWASGSGATNATVGTGNSYIGSTASDQVGSGGIKPLTGNNNYIILSPLWDNGGTADVGAATWLDGSSTSGTITTSNSLYGNSASDQVGSGGVTALANGNYLVSSPLWNNGATTDAGAVTSLRGTVASAGSVSANYSVTGSTSGVTSITPVVDTVNGNFYFRLNVNVSGQAGGTILAGSTTPTVAAITSVASTSITYGQALSYTVTATGDPGVGTNIPGAIVFSASGLPSGVSINSSTGVISASIAGTAAGTYNFTVTATNKVGSPATQSFTLTINQKTLTSTLSGTTTKTYDGNNTASINTNNIAFVGLVGSENFTFNSGTLAGTYNTANVATASTVSGSIASSAVSGINGGSTSNYVFPVSVSGTGSITTATLTASLSGTTTKTYNGNNTASINTGNITFGGLVGSENFTFTSGTLAGTYNSANVASASTVSGSIASSAVTGTNGGINSNYAFPVSVSGTGSISTATLTASLSGTTTKTYDGNNTASINTNNITFVGLVGSENFTFTSGTLAGTYNSANVLSATTVSGSIASSAVTSSTGGITSNYAFPVSVSGNGAISTATLTVTGLTGNNKTYNSSTNATASGTASLVGIIGSDTVTLGGTPVYTFASPNVGTGISISTTGYTLGGGSASNYSLTQPTLSANITQANLTIIGLTGNNKTYTATTAATASGTPSLSGVQGSDSLTITGTPVYTFASANVATGISISTTGYTISGATSGNYSLTQPTLSANITPAALLITPVNTVRPFGATNPTLTATYTGLVGGETSSVVSGLSLSTTAVFSSLVGNYPISASGASAANYSISYGNGYVTVAGAVALTDPNPSSDNGFGTITQYLTNGNVVVTAPYDDAGGTNAGAVYLFNSTTGALISTLTGSNANDRVGLTGVTSLTNGNLVVLSAQWNGGRGAVTFVDASTGLSGSVSSSNSLVGSATTDNLGLYAIFPMKNGSYVVRNPLADGNKGSVTWGSGTTGVSGTVTSTNSLVGSTATDAVGSLAITELTNGNFVVRSPEWNGARGAVTWGSKTAGVNGVVSASNSLVGSSANDEVGLGTVTALANGNFVVVSQNWDNGLATNAGAVTWLNGLNGQTREGIFGAVSSTNSIVGSTTGDKVGYGGVTALTGNNNFVVVSPNWGGTRGAATWASGTGDTYGAVSSTNSIVGRSGNADNVGSGTTPVTALGNGNYVVSSPNWGTNTGAATWGNGTSGSVGEVTSTTSLVGTVAGSYVGTGITVLSNNNFVVQSTSWNDGTNASVGAATFASGSAATTGTVTSSNSLVGSAANDRVGAKVTILKNNNYVVTSSDWSNTKGAVTWGSGTTGVSGPVTSTNSLVGSTSGDTLGSGGITVLSDNDYIVSSPLWDNGSATNAGAVTYGFAGTSTSGVVGAGNSLVGSHTNDSVGSGGITVLGSGAYVVSSPLWNSDTTTKVGAVTMDSGSGILAATVSSSNSLVGSHTDDQVGSGGVTVLSNGNFVVASPLWDSGVSNAGAVTWVSGSGGQTGAVSSSNSLVGSNANDQIGSGGVTALKLNGNYVVASPLWNGTLGAATWGDGTNGSTGTVSSSNSLVGSTSGDNVGSGGITALTGGNYLVRSANWTNNGYANAGALTWGDGTSGVQGAVAATNSLVGVSANTGLSTVSENVATGTYFVNFLTETGGARVSVGYQSPTSPAFTSVNHATFTVGEAGSFTFTASGNPASVFTLVSGSLPTGVTLNSLTGVLSGTPATGAQGTYNLTVRASNSWSGSTVDQAFTLTIN